MPITAKYEVYCKYTTYATKRNVMLYVKGLRLLARRGVPELHTSHLPVVEVEIRQYDKLNFKTETVYTAQTEGQDTGIDNFNSKATTVRDKLTNKGQHQTTLAARAVSENPRARTYIIGMHGAAKARNDSHAVLGPEKKEARAYSGRASGHSS